MSKILQVLDLIKKICNKFLKWGCVSQITEKLDLGEFWLELAEKFNAVELNEGTSAAVLGATRPYEHCRRPED